MVSIASEVQAELDRILVTRWVRESQQLSALLRHLVEETLEGRAEGLKEYPLGRAVFHRASDYDPRSDAIVRVQASVLRKRLASYYEHEGESSQLRIELPRGGYVPEFRRVGVKPTPAPQKVTLPIAEPAPPQAQVLGRTRWWPAFGSGLTVGLLIMASIGVWVVGRDELGPPGSQALWGSFVQPNVETIASFGVPLFFAGGSGLYIRDTQVNRLTDDATQVDRVGEILHRSFRPQDDVYTGIGDAIGTQFVSRWLEQRGVQATVANSNYIGESNLEGKNLVVVSSARFQTLLQQLDLPRRFVFNPSPYGGGYLIEDPLPGELPYYQPKSGAGVSTSYAVVSLWPGRTPERRIMHLSGIETWSTQGAAQYVIDPEKLSDLQRRLDADPADGPRGRKGPFFQVLLRVEGKNNRVRAADYVTHRYLPSKL